MFGQFLAKASFSEPELLASCYRTSLTLNGASATAVIVAGAVAGGLGLVFLSQIYDWLAKLFGKDEDVLSLYLHAVRLYPLQGKIQSVLGLRVASQTNEDTDSPIHIDKTGLGTNEHWREIRPTATPAAGPSLRDQGEPNRVMNDSTDGNRWL